ncbi:MAG: hypothetical protein M3Q44_07675 [bacterium]|nr:hypothetical protein [bacterium]
MNKRILLFLIISILVLGFSFYIYFPQSKTSSTAGNIPHSDLGVIYSYSTYSTKTHSPSKPQGFISDISNIQRTTFDISLAPSVHSPSYAYTGKLDAKTLSIASKDAPVFKPIIDFSQTKNASSLDTIFWSQDEKMIAYEIRLNQSTGSASEGTLIGKAEAQYYTVSSTQILKQLN